MNLIIQEYAQEHFQNKQEVITTDIPIIFDLELESWELHNILTNLHVFQTAWSDTKFNVHGFKNYDEDGNSYDVGILEVYAKDRNMEDFLELAQLFEDAEVKWMNSFDYD